MLGASVHDTTLLAETLGRVVVSHPERLGEAAQNPCLDKEYDNPTVRLAMADYQYQPHTRRIGEEKLDQLGNKRYPARRWVVERTLARLSKRRAILVRNDLQPLQSE